MASFPTALDIHPTVAACVFFLPPLLGVCFAFRAHSIGARRLLLWNAIAFLPICLGVLVLDSMCGGNAQDGYRACLNSGAFLAGVNTLAYPAFVSLLIYLGSELPILALAGSLEVFRRQNWGILSYTPLAVVVFAYGAIAALALVRY